MAPSSMRVSKIDIENFRSIPEASVKLDDFNLLIGKNNAGKSNIVKAIYQYRDLMMGDVDIRSFYESAVTRGRDPSPIKFSVTFEIGDDVRENLVEQISENHNVSASINERLLSNRSFDEFKHEVSIRATGISHNTIHTLLDGSHVELGTLDTANERVELLDLDQLLSIERTDHDICALETLNQVDAVIPSTISDGLEEEFADWKIVAPFRRTEEHGEFGANPVLDPTGENLTTFLQSIREDGSGRYSDICNTYIEIMEGVEDVRIETREGEEGSAVPTIRIDEQQSEDIGLDELSSGAKEILILVTQIVVSRSDDSPLYIEEPELHLHPAAEREIFSMIMGIAEEFDTQVIVTTHSDVFVDQVNVENIFSVKRENYTFIDTVEEGELGEVLADIGYAKSELLQADRILFVEGRSDRVVFSNWAPKLDLSFSVNGVEPVIFGGDEIFEDGNPYANEIPDLLSQMGIPYKYIFDSDGDDPQDKQRDIASRLDLSPSNIRVIQGHCIESYLADPPRALASILSVEPDDLEDELPARPLDTNVKGIFDDLFQEHLGTGYSEEKHGATIAKQMHDHEIAVEMQELLREVVTMEGRQ